MPATGNYPDYYPEIPSSVMELKDGIKNIQSTDLDGKKVVLVGTAVDGPVMEPINVSSYDEAEDIFGRYYDRATNTFNGATLMRGLGRTLAAGADNVDLLRLSGEHAETEIDLYEELEVKTFQTREYGGSYPGNDATEIDLEIEAEDGYNDGVYITNVGVMADGSYLDSYAYRVYNDEGELVINQDATNSNANLEITYERVSVNVESISGEEPAFQTDNYVEFMLENDNVIAGTVVITINPGEEGEEVLENETGFSVDEDSGLITLEEALSEDDVVEVDYDYEDLLAIQETYQTEAEGSEFNVDLDNSAIPSEPIVVTINGEEIASSDYSISYADYDTSRVFIQPGVAEKDADVYVRYYYAEERYIQPSITARSPFGGEVYNKVQFEIEDTFYEEDENRTTNITEETPQIIDANTIRTRNDHIVPDSIVVSINTTEHKDEDNDFESVNYAKGIIELPESIDSGDTVEVNYDYYNIETNIVRVKIPAEKRMQEGEIEVIVSDRISTIGELLSEINSHPQNQVVQLRIEEEYTGISAMELKTPDTKILDNGTVNKTNERLKGGKDGINISKEEIYRLLEGEGDEPGVYDILFEDEEIDIVVPLGVYADDELASQFNSFDQQLANFCARAFYHNNEVRGVIGVKPLQDPTRINIIERVNNLLTLDTNYYLTDDNGNYVIDEGQRVDIGRFISVVAHDFIYNDANLSTRSIENVAPAYAGRASMITGTNSPTNEIVGGGTLAYDYSTRQANNLAGNKLVTLKTRAGAPRINSAVTCAQPGSGWTRYHTVDIVFDVIEELRDVYDRYIGQGNTLEKRNSLDADIRKTLKEENGVVDFDYSIVQSPEDALMGRIIIELDLVPVGELQKVHTVISINAQLD